MENQAFAMMIQEFSIYIYIHTVICISMYLYVCIYYIKYLYTIYLLYYIIYIYIVCVNLPKGNKSDCIL